VCNSASALRVKLTGRLQDLGATHQSDAVRAQERSTTLSSMNTFHMAFTQRPKHIHSASHLERVVYGANNASDNHWDAFFGLNLSQLGVSAQHVVEHNCYW
jgi:hypothetical protein